MYKKLTIWSMFMLLFAAGAAAAELKIAVLDQLQALNDEIVALSEQLQKDAEVMSPAEQRRMQKEIEDKQIDLQFLGNKLQKEVNDRRQELLQQMVPKIDVVLKDLIELEGYDMIMERGSLRYVNSKHDITRRVTEKLNEKQ